MSPEALWAGLIDPIEGRRSRAIIVALLVIVFLLLLAGSVSRWSSTFDEGTHLYSGYAYWKHADFGFNPEHPPLAKLVAALPLLPLDLAPVELPADSEFKAGSFAAGRAMLFDNDADTLLFRARMSIAVFAVALICLIYLAAGRMFGPGAALAAMVLIVFEPNIIANGAIIGTDMALASCLFGAVYAFYRYTEESSISRLLICGLAVGLTLSVKHSGLLIAPILCLLAALELFQPATPSAVNRWRRSLHLTSALAAIGVVAWIVLWSSYGFRSAARPEELAMVPTLSEFAAVFGPAAAIPAAIVELGIVPEAYAFGLIDVVLTSIGRPMFLLGEVYPHGRWFYFPTAFLIKSTLGFLFLVALVPFAGLIRDRSRRRAALFLLLPAGFYLMMSMSSNLNIGYRHVLPVLPYAVVLAAAGAQRFASRGRLGAACVLTALLLHVGSSLSAFPNYLAYSNEVSGGPLETHRYLTDSSVEWGQDVKRTGEYLAEHGVTECWSALTITSFIDLDYYGLRCRPLPSFMDGLFPPRDAQPAPVVLRGPVVIGATELSGVHWGPGELNPYRTFQETTPTAVIGGSILIFDGTFESAQLAGESRAVMTQGLIEEGRIDEALQSAQEAVVLAPRSVRLRYLLAAALDRAQRSDEAEAERIEGLRLADELYPNRSIVWEYMALMNIEAEVQN